MEIDILVEHLLTELALSVRSGSSITELREYSTLFFSARDGIKARLNNESSDLHCYHNIDKLFTSYVWKCVMQHKNVRVVEEKGENDHSFTQVERVPAISETPISAGTELLMRNDPIYSSLDLTRNQEKLEALRIRTDPEQIWIAVAGHRKDFREIQALDFACLMVIAAEREKGILQPTLVKRTGQDPRSLPSRTQRLHDAGYILKLPTLMANRSRTSLLVLRRYTSRLSTRMTLNPKDGIKTNTFGAIDGEYKNVEVHAWEDFIQLAAWPRTTWTNFRHRLKNENVARAPQISDMHLKYLTYSRCVRLKPVESHRTAENHPIEVSVLRKPTHMEWQNISAQSNRKIESSNKDDQHVNISQRVFSTPREIALSEDPTTKVDEVQESTTRENMKIRTRHQLRSDKSETPWDPDRSLSNAILTIINCAGLRGLTLLDIREYIFGKFYQKPVEHQVSRLVDFWQISQPAQLRHLSLIRDTIQIGRTSMYVHLTQLCFQLLVETDSATWDSIRTLAKVQASELEIDANGFPTLDCSKRLTPRRATTLAEISQKSSMTAQSALKLRSSVRDTKFILAIKNNAVKSRRKVSQMAMAPYYVASKMEGTANKSYGSSQETSQSMETAELNSLRENDQERVLLLQEPPKQNDSHDLNQKRLQLSDSTTRGGKDTSTMSLENQNSRAVRIDQSAQPARESPASSASRVNFSMNKNNGADPSLLEYDRYLPSFAAHSGNSQFESLIADCEEAPIHELAAAKMIKNGAQYIPSLFSHSASGASLCLSSNHTRENRQNPVVRVFSEASSSEHKLPYSQRRSGRIKTRSQRLFLQQPDYQSWGPTASLTPTDTQEGSPDCLEQLPIAVYKSTKSFVEPFDPPKADGLRKHDVRSKILIFRFPRLAAFLSSISPKPSSRALCSEPEDAEGEHVDQIYQQMPTRLLSRICTMEDEHETVFGHNLQNLSAAETLAVGTKASLVDKALISQEDKNQDNCRSKSVGRPGGLWPRFLIPAANVVCINLKQSMTTRTATLDQIENERSTSETSTSTPERSSLVQIAARCQKPDVDKSPTASRGSRPVTPPLEKMFQSPSKLESARQKSPQEASKPVKHIVAKERLPLIRMKPSGGSVAAQRKQIILDILQKSGGLFPGDNELWFPFATIWMARTQGIRPDSRTMRIAKKSLIDSGKLRQYKFTYQSKAGTTVVKSIVTLEDISSDDHRVKSLQAKIIAEEPRHYFPEGVEVSSDLKRPPTKDVVSLRGASGDSKPKKRKLKEYKSDLPAPPLMAEGPLQAEGGCHSCRASFPPGHAQASKVQIENSRSQTADSYANASATNHSASSVSAVSSTLGPSHANAPFGGHDPDRLYPLQKGDSSKRLVSRSRQGDETRFEMSKVASSGSISVMPKNGQQISKKEAAQHQLNLRQTYRPSCSSNDVSQMDCSSGPVDPLSSQNPQGYSKPSWFEDMGFRIRRAEPSPKRHCFTYIDENIHYPSYLGGSVQAVGSIVTPSNTSSLVSTGSNMDLTGNEVTKSSRNSDSGRRKTQQYYLEPGSSERLLPNSEEVSISPNATPTTTSQRRTRLQKYPNRKVSNQLAQHIFIAVLISKTIAGGNRQLVNWKLVVLMMAAEYPLEDVRRTWPRVLLFYQTRFLEFQKTFQKVFIRAYQRGEIPSISFTNLEGYDWRWLHAWTASRLFPSASKSFTKLDRRNMKRSSRIRELYKHDTMDYFESIFKVTVPKRHFVLHKNAFAILYKSGECWKEPLCAMDVVKSWVRGNAVTPESSYNPRLAREKLMSLGQKNLEVAVQQLCSSKCLSLEKSIHPGPRRSYSLSDSMFVRLKSRGSLEFILQALAYRNVVDSTFGSNADTILYESLNDGTMFTIINLLATRQIILQQRRVPANRLGLVNDGYLTRQMDKKKLSFDLTLVHSRQYQRIQNTQKAPQALHAKDRITIGGYDFAMIPLWYDINDNLIPSLWNAVRLAVLNVMALRPGISSEVICATLRNSLQLFEVDLIKDWILLAGLGDFTSIEHNTVQLNRDWLRLLTIET